MNKGRNMLVSILAFGFNISRLFRQLILMGDYQYKKRLP